ncbi:MAG: DUF2860 family protein [Parahaliea sp.]
MQTLENKFFRLLPGTTGALSSYLLVAMAGAATIIPEREGFSGYVDIGAGFVNVETNMVASIASGHLDLGDDRIDSLDSSPDSETSAIPSVSFELSYTFAEHRTQVYLGNLLEDYLSFDMKTQLGVRKDVGKLGLMGIALLTTPVPTDVWRDPYRAGEKRRDTQENSHGVRLRWERIMGTGLALTYDAHRIDIDQEESGTGLNLSGAERDLLDRKGDSSRIELEYEFQLGDGSRRLTPGVSYIDYDLDGEAMARDGYRVYANFIYLPDSRWRWVLNASYATLDNKESNPIYGKKDEADRFGVSVSAFYKEPLGWQDWALSLALSYHDIDHDIDFYDTSLSAATIGLFRQF